MKEINKMKGNSNSLNEIYEFLDEILGSFIPGIYFCSFFITTIWTFIKFCSNTKIEISENIFILILFIISYVIGTMFRRSNSREPDHYSAKYIYFTSIPHDDNDFSFIKLIDDEQYQSLINDFVKKVKDKNIKVKYNKHKVIKRKRKFSLSERVFISSYKKRNNNYRLYSKPEIQCYIYKKLLKRKNIIELLKKYIFRKNKTIGTELVCINDFIKEHKLEDYCNIYVDYPYDNLKNYLEERKMHNLAKYIDWDIKDSSKKTKRTKSLICNMKNYIKHYSPSDFSSLQKTEAHIRFMNSMWYANKLLSKISNSVFLILSIISFFMFLIIDNNLLKKIYNMDNGISKIVNFLVNSTKNILMIIFGNNFETELLLRALICIVLISLLYSFCGFIIKRTLENNFHYQRIREVVNVLYIYDMIKTENDNKNV